MVDNLYDHVASDRKLAVGMAVYARWCQNGYQHREKTVIVKLDAKSVTVRLQGSCFEVKQIVLPRFCDQTRWSNRNCVWPMATGFIVR